MKIVYKIVVVFLCVMALVGCGNKEEPVKVIEIEEDVVENSEIEDVESSNALEVDNTLNENEAEKVDVFIRIHANGAEDSGVHGAMTLCQTADNPYNGELYEESRRLSDCVLDVFVEKTGAKKQHVWETDTMSGINWAAVPTTIVEMGYMTNSEEDCKMATEEYQRLMAEGMAAGIDRYVGGE